MSQNNDTDTLVDPKAFEGKTIESVDFDAVNSLLFKFTDGTFAVLEAENIKYSGGRWTDWNCSRPKLDGNDK